MNSLFNLRSRFKDRNILLVSCGPSAGSWLNVYKTIDNPLVVTIKQAAELVDPKLQSMHIYNAFNCRNYQSIYQHNHIISLFQDDLSGPRQFNDYDVRVCVTKDPQNPWGDCLALNKKINSYSINNSGYKRPWGPGIIFESALYVLEFCSPKSISLVGFDNGFAKNYSHFDQAKVQTISRQTSSKNQNLYDKTTINMFRHLASLPYNMGQKPLSLQGFDEPALVKELVELFYVWLNHKGIKFNIFTDFSGNLSRKPYIFPV